MAALNDFMAAYIPREFRATRDYIGDRGWMHLMNLLLKKIERNKLFNLSKRREGGVEVHDDYWIYPPADCRTVLKIWDPEYPEKVFYPFEIVEGRIKIYTKYEKNDDVDSFTLSSGASLGITIDDDDATTDLWENYLLVLEDGIYYRNGIIIKSNGFSEGGVCVLTFLHEQPKTVDSTDGYLTPLGTYLMIKYRSTFTPISAYNDEIPIDDKYEDLAVNWLCKESIPVEDKRQKIYEKRFKEDWDEAVVEHGTPTPDQARVDPTLWPEVDINDATHEWTGDD